MSDNRWTKRATEWQPRIGKRSRGRQPLRWSDSIAKVVPQGSVLGPPLFTLYTSPVADIAECYDVKYHLYMQTTPRSTYHSTLTAKSKRNWLKIVCEISLNGWQ
ncbi:endonuclease-reverse transcriptase [Elysia marginata]|uniref:Endonuclease-reverse transcriptase n=1 Tax=Elysia marginata TaxID=1093978 RepID=A0AAV4EM26_9GAST|nr:endonuclease-reverse transcriptase [Elysia marginata]